MLIPYFEQVLEKARHGLAANPIDRSDPIRERAIKQERADDELLSKKDEEDNTISDVFNQPQHFVAPAVLVPNGMYFRHLPPRSPAALAERLHVVTCSR